MEKVPVSAMVATQAATQQSVAVEPLTWWGRVTQFWHSIKWQGLSDGLGGTAGIMRVGLWFSAGFAVGFLFKKYFKTALIALIVTVLLIKGLELQQVLTIDWSSLKKVAGFEYNILELVKDHVVVCVAAIGGFLVGHQLG